MLNEGEEPLKRIGPDGGALLHLRLPIALCLEGTWANGIDHRHTLCPGRRHHDSLSPTLVLGCCGHGRTQPRHDLLADAKALLQVGES